MNVIQSAFKNYLTRHFTIEPGERDTQSRADCYLHTEVQEELTMLFSSVFQVFGKCDILKSHIA
jgi:hypothetical protein